MVIAALFMLAYTKLAVIGQLFEVYVEMGSESTDTATLAWIFDGQNVGDTRMFEIKVTQIECDGPLRCLIRTH